MKDKYLPIQTFFKEVEEYLKDVKNTTFEKETYIEVGNKFHIIDSTLKRNKETLAIFEFKAGATEIKAQDFYQAIPPINISYKFLVVSTGSFHKVLNRYSDVVKEFKTTKVF